MQYSRLRYALIVVLFLLLFAHQNAWNLQRERFHIDRFFEDPLTYGNHTGQRFGKVVGVQADTFDFNDGDKVIRIEGSGVVPAVLGETILYVDYRLDGRMVLIDYHNYNYNYVLYGLSLVAFFYFVWLFFREWKLTKRGFRDA